MNIFNTANINNIMTDRDIVYISLKPSFFVSLTVRSFEIFPKHNGYGLLSLYFELMDFYTPLAYNKLFTPL